MTAAEETFPLDWNEWRQVWAEWRRHWAPEPSRHRFAGRNFLADEVLGVYRIAGRDVELSEVTFCGQRFIGVTYAAADGTTSGGIHETFAELEAELFSNEAAR